MVPIGKKTLAVTASGIAMNRAASTSTGARRTATAPTPSMATPTSAASRNRLSNGDATTGIALYE